MELIRESYKYMVEWSKRKNKKPLIVDGLRQVGKTYLCEKLGKEEYENYVLYDFRHDKNLDRLFYDNDKTSVDIIINNSIVYFHDKVFEPKKTLLIFDEINDSPAARESLKLFSLDGRYDVIATGSLLGISDLTTKLIPTGYDEYLTLKPLSFIEFLYASGISNEAMKIIKNSFERNQLLNDNYLNVLYSHFLRYIIVGGMPAAVIKYLETQNLVEVRKIQTDLLKDYIADFGLRYKDDGSKVLDATLLVRISRAFNSIPDQLAKENKKFRYSMISHGGRSSEFSDALEWLEKIGLIVRAYNVRNIESPLQGNVITEEFKVFLSDIGLLTASYPITLIQEVLSGELGAYKGAIYEAVCADMLYKSDFNLFYYADSINHLENDFLIESSEGIEVIEIKATNGKMLSAKKLALGQTPYKIHKVYKLIKTGYGIGDFYESFPHFLLPFFLNDIKKKIETNLVKLEELPKI